MFWATRREGDHASITDVAVALVSTASSAVTRAIPEKRCITLACFTVLPVMPANVYGTYAIGFDRNAPVARPMDKDPRLRIEAWYILSDVEVSGGLNCLAMISRGTLRTSRGVASGLALPKVPRLFVCYKDPLFAVSRLIMVFAK